MPGMLGAQPASPAPGGGMGNDMMRMGGAAQPQSPMPMPMPMGQPQQRMSGCPMMAPMMQGGAMPQGMQGDAGMAGAHQDETGGVGRQDRFGRHCVTGWAR